ncbi:MAG: hypothetical protein IJM30_04680 [Thermoguttaceae bacterium]|nr:hypothetical protein [Thermoguttaceae bacterium]
MTDSFEEPRSDSLIYRENGVAKIYRVPEPVPFSELIASFELFRAASRATESEAKED